MPRSGMEAHAEVFKSEDGELRRQPGEAGCDRVDSANTPFPAKRSLSSSLSAMVLSDGRRQKIETALFWSYSGSLGCNYSINLSATAVPAPWSGAAAG